MLPPGTFILVRHYCRRFKPGFASFLSGLCVGNIASVFSEEKLCLFISRASATWPKVSDMANLAFYGGF